MREALLTATAVILASATLDARAEAMTLFAAPSLRTAAADTALQRHAAVVCGVDGCAHVHTSRVRPHRPRP